jgi:rhamnose utilization protein RhaD (predicted bifunctional aldolase and dehydrogenase)
MSIEDLVEISRYYGKNADYVLAGGGNTSWKDGDTLYVKASGFSLADASPASFAKMDRAALGRIWEKTYPEASAERESAVLSDLMSARKTDAESMRPSVETLLHDIIPFDFVVHLHPALVNGLTCSKQGEAAMTKIFGEDAIWIPPVNPGYVLSKVVKTAMDAYKTKHGGNAAVIFLQNHGVFAGGGSAESVKETYGKIMDDIDIRTGRRPDFSDEKRLTTGDPEIEKIIKTLSELAGAAVFIQSREIKKLVKDQASFYPVSSAFTPDHIVYSGSDPLFTDAQKDSELKDAWKSHLDKTGIAPKITAVKGLGVFGTAATEKAANLALDLFRDTVKVAVYSQSFGGPLFMTEDKIDFINNWEVERYRTSVSLK